MLISGRDLLDPPYQLNKKAILDLCVARKLEPFIRALGRSYYPDPKAPEGWQRVFPTEDLQKKHKSVCTLYYHLEFAQAWLSKSNDTHIKAHEQHLVALDRYDKEKKERTPSIEIFKANLPDLRQRYADTVRGLPPQIKKLEGELTLARAWQNIDATFETVCAVLMDAYFNLDDAEKVCRATPKQRAEPARNKQPHGPAQAAVRQYKTEYHDERLSVEQFCDTQLKKKPKPTQAETLREVTKKCSHNWKHSIPISTLRKWIARKY
jgi:hypothetical protein